MILRRAWFRRSSRTAPFASARARARAFTLIEILLVLALIGMMTGVFVVGVANFSDDKPATPDEVLWAAIGGARKQALMSGREVRLLFVASGTNDGSATSAMLIATWDQSAPSTIAQAGQADQPEQAAPSSQLVFPFTNMGDVVCDFLSVQKATSSILVGGQLIETQTIPSVTFYNDGTCTPFRVQMHIGTSVHTLAVDPWTCAAILKKAEESP